MLNANWKRMADDHGVAIVPGEKRRLAAEFNALGHGCYTNDSVDKDFTLRIN